MSVKTSRQKSKTNIYWERNMLALLIANQTEGSGWYYDEKAMNTGRKRVLSIGYGHTTFHVPDDFDLGDLPQIEDDWDGHTTKEKWERVAKLCGMGG